MKMHSIQTKLLTIGLLSVLLPLLVVGYFSVTKSSQALTALSEDKAQSIAADLARLTGNLMQAEQKTAETLGDSQLIRNNLEKLVGANNEEAREIKSNLFTALERRFKVMNAGKQYQGIFVTDASGQILAGVLSGGEEYGKVSVANNEEFKRAKQSEKGSLGEMIQSQATSKLIIPIAAPVLSSNSQLEVAPFV